jgi:lipid-A-disaccharide synthase
MKKIFIIAGEHSGDMHGAELAAALHRKAPDIALRGLGGPRMRAAGVELLIETTSRTVMGLTEVVSALPSHVRMLGRTVREILAWRPDVVIPVDYPDFNLRVVRRVSGSGVGVVYYVSPQVWAWRAGRVKLVRKYVDKMMVIFPFEVDFYRKRGVDAVFVGHPLLDRLSAHPPVTDLSVKLGVPDGAPIVGILPGSRTSVYSRHWSTAWEAAQLVARERPDAHFVAAVSGGISRSVIEESKRNAPSKNFHFHEQDGGGVIASSTAVLTTSGTATVESAILGTPMVIFYKVSPVSYAIAKRMVSVPFIGMCNLIAGREVAPEFIQHDAKPEKLAAALIGLLSEDRQKTVRSDLAEVRKKLGTPGASDNAASEVLAFLESKTP